MKSIRCLGKKNNPFAIVEWGSGIRYEQILVNKGLEYLDFRFN